MALTITSVSFELCTVYKGFEVHADIVCDQPWDIDEDQVHVNHLNIRAHNCGTEFVKSFANEYDVAESFCICDCDVDFVIKDFQKPDIEELVLDFLRAFLLGLAPFAMEHGWWCSADRARLFS